jgi:hypothetical protein
VIATPEEKPIWESKTEWIGFVVLVAGLIVSFGAVELSETQIQQLAQVSWVIIGIAVMAVRAIGSGGKIKIGK